MNDKLDKLKRIFEVANEDYATYAQVAKLTQSLVTATQASYKALQDSVAQHKASLTKEAREALDIIRDREAAILKRFSAIEAELRRRADNAAQHALEEVKRIEELIPELPDYSDDFEAIKQGVETLAASIAEPDAPEDIRNKLEVLNGDERLSASAIKGLEDLLKTHSTDIKKLQGASQTPSPLHWPRHETFTMDGVATTVTLAQAVGAAGTAIFGVRYQGQTLDFDEDYTVDGNKITFVGFTPEPDTIISVSYMP